MLYYINYMEITDVSIICLTITEHVSCLIEQNIITYNDNTHVLFFFS